MPPRSLSWRPLTRLRSWLALPVAGALAVSLLGSLPATPAYAANPVTPGNFTGYGFDQCNAPSQSAMSTWIKRSPYRAAGIYISGNSRACRTQANLTPTWVSTQLAAGWHLLPITLGPQASCSARFPRYGRSVDPTINPSSAGTYAAARAQGKAEATQAVSRATALGIVAGSTIFYDLESFDIADTACRSSALWFVHAWTDQLHAQGYASGFYSSAASGIKVMDEARVRPGNPIHLPDQIWVARWDKVASTSTSYLRSDGWQPHARVKQYVGDVSETWGGVRISIDRNWLDLRTPKLPGVSTPAPTPTPTPAPQPPATTPPTTPPATSTPAYTGTSMTDPRCSPATIDRTSYRRVGPARTDGLVALQCLLKQRRLYPYAVTGTWNTPTQTALGAFQKRVSHPVHAWASRSDWASLLVVGNARTTLRAGATGADVTRVQRALNATGAPALRITSRYDAATAAAVAAYQKALGLSASRVVVSATWTALEAGRL